MDASALEAIKLAMASTNQLFHTEVFGKRNLAALDDIYTKDARILPPGAPMIAGREAIKAFWGNVIESLNATSAALDVGGCDAGRRWLVEIGERDSDGRAAGTARGADGREIRRLLAPGRRPLEVARRHLELERLIVGQPLPVVRSYAEGMELTAASL